MADAPPPGPPPPKVPEGWKAVWNSQYNEWFYVNKFTKASQWDKPTEPAVDPNSRGEAAPDGPPPAYLPSSTNATSTNEKHNPNNPYNQTKSKQDVDADARYAAQLQAEEDARARNARPTSSSGGTRGAADSYYSQSGGNSGYGGRPSYPTSPASPPGYGSTPQQQPQAAPQQDAKRGFLGKLLGKSSQPQQQYGQQQGYGHPQYPPQGQYYGQGYPPQNYYGPPQPQYQQAPPQQQQKSSGIGAGGALLGAGAGLVGGALLMDAFEDHEQFEEQQAYQMGEDQGYNQGYDQGYDQGQDYGGGDF